MKKTCSIILVLLSLFLFTACFSSVVRGSGKVIHVERELHNFRSIELMAGIDVVVNIADTISCHIQGEDNIVPIIVTEVKDGNLQISIEKNYITRKEQIVYLEVPALREVILYSSGTITINNVDQDSLHVRVVGSGTVAGEGKVREITVITSEIGDVDFSELEGDIVHATVEGTGDIRVNATEILNAKIRGIGNIYYSGSPGTVNLDDSGLGDIRKE